MEYYGKEDNQKNGIGRYLFKSISLLVCLVILGFCFKIFFDAETIEDRKKLSIDELAEIQVRRGSILDRFGNPLAVSLVDSSIYVKPREFPDISETTKQLADLLDLSAGDLFSEIKTQKSYTWLARHIPFKTVRQIAELDLPGVYIVSKINRVYPHNFKVPGIIGEVSQEEGLSGLEYQYNDLLLGKGEINHSRDLYLTLDLRTQVELEKKLSILLEEMRSGENGQGQQAIAKAIVLDTETGGIIACGQQSAGKAASVSSLSLEEQSSHFFSDYVDPGAFEELFRQAAILRLGQRKPADNGTKENRVITPAGVKKNINPPTGSAWQKLPAGYLVEPWFAEFLTKMELSGQLSETQPNLSDLELAAFSAGLGFSSPMSLDLPGQEFLKPRIRENKTFLVDEKAKVLPLNLLSGFSCLLTGKAMPPHFLKEVSPEMAGVVNFNDEITGGIFRGINDILLSRISRGSSGKAGNIFVIGSLKAREKGETGSTEPAYMDGVVLALAKGGKNKDIAMLLTLENYLVNKKEPPPFKPVVTRFLESTLKNLNRREKVSSDDLEVKEQKYLNSWFIIAKKDNSQSRDGADSPREMPDLRGMSIRQALRHLQNLEVPISIQGSGIVTKQSPEPGQRVENTVCVLKAESNKAPREKKVDDNGK